jgi:hypothetical protein
MPGFSAALLLCALNAQNEFQCLREDTSTITLKKEALTVEIKSPLQVGDVSAAGVCLRDSSDNVRCFNGDGLEILWRDVQGQKREAPKGAFFQQDSDVLCSQASNSKLSCFSQHETWQQWEFWGQSSKESDPLAQSFQVQDGRVCFTTPSSVLRCFERPKDNPQGVVLKAQEINFTDTFGRKLELKTLRFYLESPFLCGVFSDEKGLSSTRCFDASGKEFLSQTKAGFPSPFPIGEQIPSAFGLCFQSKVKNSPNGHEISCYDKETKKPLEFFNEKDFAEDPPTQGSWVGHANSARVCLNNDTGAQCWKEGKHEVLFDTSGRKVSPMPKFLNFFGNLVCSQDPQLRCWNEEAKEISFRTPNAFRVDTAESEGWQANTSHLCGINSESQTLVCFRHSGTQIPFPPPFGGSRAAGEKFKVLFLQ